MPEPSTSSRCAFGGVAAGWSFEDGWLPSYPETTGYIIETFLAASALLTGLAGALYAHKIAFVTPDQFTIMNSVELLVLVVVGGLGSLHGAVLGAAFIVMLPQFIIVVRETLAISSAYQTGLDAGAYGLLLVLFTLFEPQGLYGRWVKIKAYLDLFPFYRRASFRRQRLYHRSEQLR